MRLASASLQIPPSRVAARRAIAAAIGLYSLLPVGAAAQTTGWSQFQGGPAHRGVAADGPSPPFAEAWTLDEPLGGATGAEGLSGVVAADGVVVTVGPDTVIALDAATGVERWTIDRAGGPAVQPATAAGPDGTIVVFPEGYGPNAPTSATPSPTASPVADDDDDDARTVELVAVALDGGDEVWRTELPSPSRSGVTATADGSVVLVGGNEGSVSAVEASSGDVRWTQDVGGSVDAAIAATDELALVSAPGEDGGPFAVVGLTLADGSEAWRYEPGAATFFGSPAAIGDATAYVATDDATVRAIDAANGQERWIARMNDITAATPPIVLDDVVIAADVGGQVYAFDPVSGARRWDHALNVGRPNVRSAPVSVGTSVVVPTARGELFAVEQATGDLVWSADVADGLVRSLAVADGRVIAVRGGTEPGLVAFEHDPSGTLVRIESPTIFDAGDFATALAVAAVPMVLVVTLAGKALAARLGPPTLGRSMPRDPIEDAIDEDGTT